MKDGIEPAQGRDLAAAMRSARPARRWRPRASTGSTSSSARDTWLFSHQRRHRRVHGVRRRRADAAGLRGRAAGALRSARASRPGTRTGSPLIGEVGELVITEPMPSMPVFFWDDQDGARCARPTSRCTPASGATATGSRSPTAAPRSSTAAPTRRSTAAACGWARARSTARCSSLDEITDALVVDVPRDGRGLDAAVRRARATARSSTTT